MQVAGTVQSGKADGSHVRFSSVAMVVLGCASIFLPAFAGISISVVAGTIILLAGLAYGSFAFDAFRKRTFLWRLLMEIVFALVSCDLAGHPAMALASLTLLIAVTFAFEGVAEIISYLGLRPPAGSGYLLVNGTFSLVLAVFIWQRWPASSAWAVGTLIGINLIFTGFTRLLVSPPTAPPARDLAEEGSQEVLKLPIPRMSAPGIALPCLLAKGA